MVAPSGRCSSPMTRACFEPARGPAEPPAGAQATGNWPKAAQRRCTAVFRSLNFVTGAVPGSAFQIAAIWAFDIPLVSISFADRTRNSSSEALAGAEAVGRNGIVADDVERHRVLLVSGLCPDRHTRSLCRRKPLLSEGPARPFGLGINL